MVNTRVFVLHGSAGSTGMCQLIPGFLNNGINLFNFVKQEAEFSFDVQHVFWVIQYSTTALLSFSSIFECR